MGSIHKASNDLLHHLPRGCIVSAESLAGVASYSVVGQDFSKEVSCENLIFEIGSTSKIFTALLLCIAILEKRVSFESTIGELLPELDGSQRCVADITLLDLVTHTSGLPRDPEHPIETWDYYHDRDLIFPREELFAQLLDIPPIEKNQYYYSKFGIGVSSGYSNFGYSVLAETLATVYEGELCDLIRDKITSPLGLSDTVFPSEVTDNQNKRVLSSFNKEDEMPPEKYDAMAGCGALLSTAADLMKFAGFLQVPEESELEEAIRLLKTKLPGHSDLGVGIRTWSYHENQIYEHGGMTYGCSCLFAFWNTIDRIAVILTSNTALPAWAILRHASGDITRFTKENQSEQVAAPNP